MKQVNKQRIVGITAENVKREASITKLRWKIDNEVSRAMALQASVHDSDKTIAQLERDIEELKKKD